MSVYSDSDLSQCYIPDNMPHGSNCKLLSGKFSHVISHETSVCWMGNLHEMIFPKSCHIVQMGIFNWKIFTCYSWRNVNEFACGIITTWYSSGLTMWFKWGIFTWETFIWHSQRNVSAKMGIFYWKKFHVMFPHSCSQENAMWYNPWSFTLFKWLLCWKCEHWTHFKGY